MAEQAEILKSPEEIAESLLDAIEKSRAKILRRLKKKRKKLVEFVQAIGENFDNLTQKWSKSFATVALTAGLFLTTAGPITAASIPEIVVEKTTPTVGQKEALRQRMLTYLEKLGTRKRVNSQALAHLVGQITGLRTKVILEGRKIPAVYGEIATEKHLRLYPAEKLSDHLADPSSFAQFSWTGISQIPSAWGYFAQNRNQVTTDLIEKERYYLAIQTFEAANWNLDWPELKDWYKFRKLLVYNPENGKAAVGVVADAGPAKYTGRAFGGSPELMIELELESTGKVLVFFLDDPGNLVPLGPVWPEPKTAVLERQNQ